MLQVVWLYGHNHKVTVGSDPKEYDQIQQKRITVYLYIYLYQYAIIYIYIVISFQRTDQIRFLCCHHFFCFLPAVVALVKPRGEADVAGSHEEVRPKTR